MMPKNFKKADTKRAVAATRVSLEAWRAADDIHRAGLADNPIGREMIKSFKELEAKKRDEATWLLSLHYEPPPPIRFVLRD